MTETDRVSLMPDPGRAVDVLGIMGGTSMDGLDLAMLRFTHIGFEVLDASLYHPFDALDRKVHSGAMGKMEDEAAHRRVTEAHVKAVETWLKSRNHPRPHLIGFHGQTILHDPGQKVTIRVGDPQEVADAVDIPVVADLRQRDIEKGGQGAPLVPVYHQFRLGSVTRPTAILNIGGVTNITWMDASGSLVAFDVGPGNAPLDDWALEHIGEPMDRDGALAAGGKVMRPIIDQFMGMPFFEMAPPKSLDREERSRSREMVRDLSPADGAATMVAMTVEAVVRCMDWLPTRLHTGLLLEEGGTTVC